MSRDLSVIGHALAAPVRAAFLSMLMDGTTRPASELAASAGVSPSTASEHLGVLLDTGIVTCTPRGRQRFYRIADVPVAAALEQLGHLCPPVPATSYTEARAGRQLARARLCYDHLAGRLGIALVHAMATQGWVDDDLVLTPAGDDQLPALGIDVPALRCKRRPLTRSCPDWTERRPHLAGSLGAAIATHFIHREWLSRRGRERALSITDHGHRELGTIWRIDLSALEPAG